MLRKNMLTKSSVAALARSNIQGERITEEDWGRGRTVVCVWLGRREGEEEQKAEEVLSTS